MGSTVRRLAIAVAVTLLPVLSAMGAGSSVMIVGQTRPATRPEQVKVYLSPPGRFEQIAIIEATSQNSWTVTAQGKMDKVMERLKERAAEVGANGILLQGAGTVSGGSVQTGNATATSYGSYAYGTGTGVSVPITHKSGSAIAIYVDEDFSKAPDASKLLVHGTGNWTDAFDPSGGLMKQWEGLVMRRISLYPDFNAVVFAPDLKISRDMLWRMAGSQLAADIAYYLGSNKDEAARIYDMPDAESRRAILAIEAKLPARTVPSSVDTVPAPSQTRDVYDELLKLDELRKKGILTQEEFDAQKKKILAGG